MTHYLVHHGVDGQKWGDRNGPPYPLSPEKASINERRAQRMAEKKEKLQKKLDAAAERNYVERQKKALQEIRQDTRQVRKDRLNGPKSNIVKNNDSKNEKKEKKEQKEQNNQSDKKQNQEFNRIDEITKKIDQGKKFIDSGVGLAKSVKSVKELMSGSKEDRVSSINSYADFFKEFDNLSESEIKRAADKLKTKHDASAKYDAEKQKAQNEARRAEEERKRATETEKSGDSNKFYYEYTPGNSSNTDRSYSSSSERTYVNLDPDDYRVWEPYGELPAPQKRKRGS